MIFLLDLPLWILFLKLINEQAPVNTLIQDFSEESFSSASFQGHMLICVLVLESFQRTASLKFSCGYGN